MSADWDRVQQLFLDALERPEAERAPWLTEACAGDDGLRSEVAALLAGHDEGPLGDIVEDRPFRGRYPDRIGDYRIIRPVGSGGMGTVFLAERELDGFSQTVALKLLPPGLLSGSLESRLRAERRILARLEHPGIARLIDGGVTAEGEPYFAMEYVRGQDLLGFAALRSLGVHERVALLAEVCDAVHYAHQQLVVHRDIKPSNIMVGDDGRPKLLDFGVAKMLDEESGDRTRTGAWVTPAYASPEQLRGEPVTTLSDVYALGLILYELLTASRPHATDTRSAPDLLRERMESPPTRPSQRVTQSLPGVAWPEPADRARTLRLTPTRLRRALAGDLDLICLRALAVDPGRRYPSAAALADDLRRYLTGHPVEARPDSWGYRMGRFARRHKAAAGIGAAALVAVIGGSLTTAWQARRASQEAEEARRQRDRAEAEALRTRRIADLVTGLFQLTDPTRTRGDTITALRLLEEGTARIQEELAGDPATQADLLGEVVSAYRNLGLLDRAETVASRRVDLRAATPDDPLAHARALADLGDALAAQGRYDGAASRYREALARLPGPADTTSARIESSLGWTLRSLGEGDAARAAFLSALAIQESHLGPSDLTTASTRMGLASVEHDAGRFDEAAALFRAGLPDDPTRAVPDPGIAQTLSDLGMLYRIREEVEAAEPLIRAALEMRRTLYGDDHPTTLDSWFQWGAELFGLGRWREAETVLRESLERAEAALGPDHPTRLDILQMLAQTELGLGRFRSAADRADESLRRKTALRGADHPSTVFARLLAGTARADAGDRDGARRALDAVLGTSGEPGQEGVYGMLALAESAELALDAGDPEGASRLLARAEARGEELLREEHRYRRDLARLRARVLNAEGRFDEAAALLARTLEQEERLRPPGHPITGWTRRLYGEALRATGRDAEAETALRRAAIELEPLDPTHPWRARLEVTAPGGSPAR